MIGPLVFLSLEVVSEFQEMLISYVASMIGITGGSPRGIMD